MAYETVELQQLLLEVAGRTSDDQDADAIRLAADTLGSLQQDSAARAPAAFPPFLRLLSDRSETSRGFRLITFCDANGNSCEIQQSSAIDDTERGQEQPGSSYVWLGIFRERMHLHRDHVHELICVLGKWLRDGTF